jgi:scyllo-inositol 2-dehydrogenase (NADP+)
VVENRWPIPEADGPGRGVLVEGPVASRRLGRWRVFRYEVRCWPVRTAAPAPGWPPVAWSAYRKSTDVELYDPGRIGGAMTGAGTRRPIGVGLIGYGLAGSVLHGPLIDAEERLRLEVVASGRPERVHRDFPAVRVVSTPAELLEDPAVDLVVVAAPNEAHFQLASLALRAGRHVVVEKPLAPRSSEADQLIRLAERQDRLLSAFHQRRWDGDFLTVQRCLQAGLLGRVSSYRARWDRFRPRPEGGWRDQDLPGSGVLHDLGAHLVDQALCLFGPPATVLADVGAQRPGAVTDDWFHLVLGYDELRVVLQAGSLVRAPGPRFEVDGDRGSLVKYGLDPQAKMLEDGLRPGDPGWGLEPEDRHATVTTELGGLQLTGRLATVPGAWPAFYRQMAEAILGEGQVPVAPRSARDVVWVLECASRSSRQGQVVWLR